MNERKEKLAKYLERSRTKKAARGNAKKLTKKRVDSDRLKSLKKYHASKSKLSKLKEEEAKLQAELEATEKDMHDCRSEMLKLTDVLRNMDLADCKHVMMYENSEDVGYIVDNDEHHLDVDDNGDISFISMKDYRRQKKKEDKEDSDDLEDQDVNDADDQKSDDYDLDFVYDDMSGSVGGLIPGVERISDPESPRTEEQHEELYEEGKFYPNFRFGD